MRNSDFLKLADVLNAAVLSHSSGCCASCDGDDINCLGGRCFTFEGDMCLFKVLLDLPMTIREAIEDEKTGGVA